MKTQSRLKVGIDVPWVTRWSAEEVTGVGPCETVGGRMAVRQADLPGFGRPIYSMNHFRRQRESVRSMLCPMCGAPTRHGDRWSQTGRRHPAGVMRARGLEGSIAAATPDARIILDAGAIAPGHRVCMERSLQHCPHLGALEDRELKAFPSLWKVTPMLVEAVLERPSLTDAATGETKPSTVVAIAFLQICGVTDVVDVHWRRLL